MSNPKSRNRLFAFTLNNPSKEEIASIESFDCEYLFQEEKGEETKTEHLQGMLYFKNARFFAAVRKLLPRAHIEVGKSKAYLCRYCSKDDTRSGRIYSNFDYQKEIDTIGTDTSNTLKRDIVSPIISEIVENQMKEHLRQCKFWEMIYEEHRDVWNKRYKDIPLTYRNHVENMNILNLGERPIQEPDYHIVNQD